MSEATIQLSTALSDFRAARNRAMLERLRGQLTGKPAELLSYEDVRRLLRVRGVISHQLQDIPLDAIVGSVGRYSDFTRNFMPLNDDDMMRWARIKVAMTDMTGLPPIDVYQVGDAYFVLDGNHRVSVARELGATHIQAYVTKVDTRVPLSPDDDLDDLILKGEYAEFLEKTRLDELRPEADFTVTVPGKYPLLLEHIDVHRYYMGLELQRDVSYQEAVTHWYDTVYWPVIQAIRRQDLLRDFPNRTETDLYLWLSRHKAGLEESLGVAIEPEAALADLVARHSARPARVAARVGEKLRDALIPDELEGGRPPGYWRKKRSENQINRLFRDILVAINGEERGWQALDQALLIAGHEHSRLHGLHVVPEESQFHSKKSWALRSEFSRRCGQAGATGELAIAVGAVARQINAYARWADLTVAPLAHPPGEQPLTKLASGFRTLLRLSPTPVLVVPAQASALQRALLAYDGSPKAEEALFLAAYLAGSWPIALAVVIAAGEEVAKGTGRRAMDYLDQNHVRAELIRKQGPAGPAIIAAAQEYQADLIIMGSYGHSPLVEVVLGSALDHVLRHCRQPVLICR